MRVYLFLNDGGEIAGKCIARDVDHAREKFAALYGAAFHPCATVLSWQEYCAERRDFKEWMREPLTQEQSNAFPKGRW